MRTWLRSSAILRYLKQSWAYFTRCVSPQFPSGSSNMAGVAAFFTNFGHKQGFAELRRIFFCKFHFAFLSIPLNHFNCVINKSQLRLWICTLLCRLAFFFHSATGENWNLVEGPVSQDFEAITTHCFVPCRFVWISCMCKDNVGFQQIYLRK